MNHANPNTNINTSSFNVSLHWANDAQLACQGDRVNDTQCNTSCQVIVQ